MQSINRSILSIALTTGHDEGKTFGGPASLRAAWGDHAVRLRVIGDAQGSAREQEHGAPGAGWRRERLPDSESVAGQRR